MSTRNREAQDHRDGESNETVFNDRPREIEGSQQQDDKASTHEGSNETDCPSPTSPNQELEPGDEAVETIQQVREPDHPHPRESRLDANQTACHESGTASSPLESSTSEQTSHTTACQSTNSFEELKDSSKLKESSGKVPSAPATRVPRIAKMVGKTYPDQLAKTEEGKSLGRQNSATRMRVATLERTIFARDESVAQVAAMSYSGSTKPHPHQLKAAAATRITSTATTAMKRDARASYKATDQSSKEGPLDVMLQTNSGRWEETKDLEAYKCMEKQNSAMNLRLAALERTVFGTGGSSHSRGEKQPITFFGKEGSSHSKGEKQPITLTPVRPDQEAPQVQPGAVSVPGVTGIVVQIDSSEDDSGPITIGNQAANSLGSAAGDLIQAYTVSEALNVERADLKAEVEEEVRQGIKAEVEREIRQQIMDDALEANVVAGTLVDNGCSIKRKWKVATGCTLLLLLATLLAVFLGASKNNSTSWSLGQTNKELNGEHEQKNSTLQIIRDRGYIKCGVDTKRLGFCSPSITGELQGINVDQCKALSIAIFGVPNKITHELVPVHASTRFLSLQTGEVDVLTSTVTHTMERDVYLRQTKSGFTFSTPYLYTGLTFFGPKEYVECAEALDTTTGICKNLTVCYSAFGTHDFVLRSFLPPEAMVPVSTYDQLGEHMRDGTCVAGAADSIYQFSSGLTSGTKLFSKEPLTIVTREDDHEFSSLVDLVANTFFIAEAHGISYNNSFQLAPLVGDELASMLTPIVSELGNYGDMYERNLLPLGRRQGMNYIYTTSDHSGLLYGFPFGQLTQHGPDPIPGGNIASVQATGLLRCGVVDRGEGTYNAFDAQFCRAVSAALFEGNINNLEVMASSVDASFETLQEGRVDVLAGVLLSPEHAFKETTTGKGLSLSKPYHYDTMSMKAYGFATTAEDPKWRDLIDWVIMATIYAEESGIKQASADDMPLLNLFGQGMTTLLQDVVAGVGSYDEIYSQTLEVHLPREGSGNELNHELSGPQLFAL